MEESFPGRIILLEEYFCWKKISTVGGIYTFALGIMDILESWPAQEPARGKWKKIPLGRIILLEE